MLGQRHIGMGVFVFVEILIKLIQYRLIAMDRFMYPMLDVAVHFLVAPAALFFPMGSIARVISIFVLEEAT